MLPEALARADQHGEHFHEAEQCRLKGDLLLTHAAAQAFLAPIYGWFTEGFDTADLQAAQALLHTLKAAACPHCAAPC